MSDYDDVMVPYRIKRKMVAADRRISEAYALISEISEELREEFGDYVADVWMGQHKEGLYHGDGSWNDAVLTHHCYMRDLKGGE